VIDCTPNKNNVILGLQSLHATCQILIANFHVHSFVIIWSIAWFTEYCISHWLMFKYSFRPHHMKISGVWYITSLKCWFQISFRRRETSFWKLFCFRCVIRRTPECQNYILGVFFLARLGWLWCVRRRACAIAHLIWWALSFSSPWHIPFRFNKLAHNGFVTPVLTAASIWNSIAMIWLQQPAIHVQ